MSTTLAYAKYLVSITKRKSRSIKADMDDFSSSAYVTGGPSSEEVRGMRAALMYCIYRIYHVYLLCRAVQTQSHIQEHFSGQVLR